MTRESINALSTMGFLFVLSAIIGLFLSWPFSYSYWTPEGFIKKENDHPFIRGFIFFGLILAIVAVIAGMVYINIMPVDPESF